MTRSRGGTALAGLLPLIVLAAGIVQTLPAEAADSASATVSAVDLAYLLDGEATPGRPVTVTLHVATAAGTALAKRTVHVSIDHGYLTSTDADGRPVPAIAPTEGAQFGTWVDHGTSGDVVTDRSGDARVTVAIGPDPGFEDDAAVTTTIDASVGGVPTPSAATVTWQSTDPLTVSTLDVDYAHQRGGGRNTQPEQPNLPAAANPRPVFLDAIVRDQFGNPTVTDAAFASQGAGSVSTDFTAAQSVAYGAPFFHLTARAPGQTGPQSVRGTLRAPRTDYTLASGSARRRTSYRTVTAIRDLVWYDETTTVSQPQPMPTPDAAPVPAVRLSGGHAGSGDRLHVFAPAGSRIRIYRFVSHRGRTGWKLVATRTVRATRVSVRVRDVNGSEISHYRARIGGTTPVWTLVLDLR